MTTLLQGKSLQETVLLNSKTRWAVNCAKLPSKFWGPAVDAASPLSAAGMDSLQAIRFAADLRSLGLEISALDILNSRALSDLHALISHRNKRDEPPQEEHGNQVSGLDAAEVAAAVHALDLNSIEAALECTPLQASMLSETTLDPQAYCNWIELAFSNDCTADQVHSSFSALAQRNEILRTGFSHYDGRFVQIVWRSLEDTQLQSVREFDVHFRLHTDQSLLRPFNIQVKNSPSGAVRALVRIHHALYDGWSEDLMLKDLDALLRGDKLAARPPFRRTPGASYLNF